MKVYLAGTQGNKGQLLSNEKGLYLLESFEYLTDANIGIYKNHNFLLDSGAFTHMNKKSKNGINWNEYIKKYANFINKHNVELFFELDIDVIIGLKEVERLREKLENLTNKKCIPVWHKSRGKDYWLKMVKEYDYVAIGGIVTREIKPSEYRFFTWLLNEAKKENCKVHGLGFTRVSVLHIYPFYSIDSTTWIGGQKFGKMQIFNGRTFDNFQPSKLNGNNLRAINPKGRLIHNFKEWIKFQKYAENNL